MDIEDSYKQALGEIKELDLPEEDRNAVLTAAILKNLLQEGVSSSKINASKEDKEINIDWEDTPYQEDSLAYNILKCVEEGFFNNPRNSSDILAELERKAVTCKSEDSLTRPLRSLVQDGYLERKKQENSEGKKVWHYISPTSKGRG